MGEERHYLVARLADEFAGDPSEFFRLVDHWATTVQEREFTFNVVDVTVNFTDSSAELADVLDPHSIHRLSLNELRRQLEG